VAGVEIKNQIALVTGANRGIGRSLVAELQRRGVAKVYAAARRPETVDLPGAVPLGLDITDDASVAEAAAVATDVTVLINNAGVATLAKLVDGAEADIRQEMETNYFGTLRMVRAFALILKANGGGAVLNVLSVMAWMAYERSHGWYWSRTRPACENSPRHTTCRSPRPLAKAPASRRTRSPDSGRPSIVPGSLS
jgi:NAD(P)-dependent dehydrogenase (short-subunit alcohol dehydrogenase family)